MIPSGICHCGDDMDNHYVENANHSPVEMMYSDKPDVLFCVCDYCKREAHAGN